LFQRLKAPGEIFDRDGFGGHCRRAGGREGKQQGDAQSRGTWQRH